MCLCVYGFVCVCVRLVSVNECDPDERQQGLVTAMRRKLPDTKGRRVDGALEGEKCVCVCVCVCVCLCVCVCVPMCVC